MNDMPNWIREAFESDSIPKKNIALRLAHDQISHLKETLVLAEQGLNAAVSQFSVSHIALEAVRAAIANSSPKKKD